MLINVMHLMFLPTKQYVTLEQYLEPKYWRELFPKLSLIKWITQIIQNGVTGLQKSINISWWRRESYRNLLTLYGLLKSVQKIISNN